MTLVPLASTTITVPEYWFVKGRIIAGNSMWHLGRPHFNGRCAIYEYGSKCYVARFESTELYSEIYIKLPRCRVEPPADAFVVSPIDHNVSIYRIDERTEFKWVTYPRRCMTSVEIVQSWEGKFQFIQEKPEADRPGLRRPQLGAVHAIAAFENSRVDDPGTVVLPTGTGKTETMLASLTYGMLGKVLVLVPSDSLRQQIAKKFMTLGYLPSINVLPMDVFRPRVAILKRGIIDSEKCAELISDVNVVVATPSCLQNFSSEALHCLCSECTHLFIDEAHHVAATTWSAIRDIFKGKKIIQFTATPFRRDGKSLEGKVLYKYSLSEAQADGLFRHIRLHTIEEYNSLEADDKIASEALNILKSDIDEQYDHILMARVRSIERANEVLTIYRRLGSQYSPVVIHSRMPQREKDHALHLLQQRITKVVVCVDMLGEGFDLPNLKVAAIHDEHKSLAVTLQFIGRFTRIERSVGDAAAVINVGDPKVQEELTALYAENADWDELLRVNAERRIGKELELLSVVDSLRDEGDLAKHVSLWNLRPSFSSIIYRTICEQWSPREFHSVLPEKLRFWHAISHQRNLLVLVALRSEEVKWGKYRDIKDKTYEILLCHWDRDKSALFIHSSDYEFFKCNALAEAICGNNSTRIFGEEVFRIFAGVERPLVRNLGAARAGTISFTMYFGPNVTDGLAHVERSESELSNLTGWGYEDGYKVAWGCSQKKGKVWSVKSGAITDWRDWCLKAWDKIRDTTLEHSEIVTGFLRPKKLDQRHPFIPLSIQWGEKIASEPEDRVTISIGENDFYLHQVDLQVDEYTEDGPVKFSILGNNDVASTIELYIVADQPRGYFYRITSGPEVSIKRGNGLPKSFEEYMVNDPVVMHYTDGSFSYNNFIVYVREEAQIYDFENIEFRDWAGTDIRKESQGKSKLVDSIQYRVSRDMFDDFRVLFDDDSSGEAADIIAIKFDNNKVHLTLVHCKFSSDETPGARIDDLYAVCGQAQKCIRWKHNGFSYLADHMKKREALWAPSHSRFIKGNFRDLYEFKKIANRCEVCLEVVIVQPGLSKSALLASQNRGGIGHLLSSTDLFLKKTANARLRVIGSR